MKNKEKNFVSAVVYLYNEEAQIGSYLEGLENTLRSNFEEYEIIVVNDMSTDDGEQAVRDYASSKIESKVTLMNMGYHQGMEISLDAGVDLAIGDYIFEIEFVNSDYDWDVIMAVYWHSLEGFDIVHAKGKVRCKFSLGSLFYKIMNRCANFQYPLLKGGSFRIVSRRAVNRIHSLTKRIPYRKVAYSNCGLKCDTILYDCMRRVKLRKVSGKLDLATSSLVLFTDIAFYIAFWYSIAMGIISVGIVIYSIVSFILERPVDYIMFVLLIVSLVLCGLFVTLAFVIRYLSALVRLNFLKKDYVFESIEKLQK